MPVASLFWPDLDPATNPFEISGTRQALVELLEKPLRDHQIRSDKRAGLPVCRFDAEDHWEFMSIQMDILSQVTRCLIERHGPWAEGWRFSVGEGDGCGGVVRAWCSPEHSWTSDPSQFADCVLASLREWRSYLEALAALYDEARHGFGPETKTGDFCEITTRIVAFVAKQTSCDDGWCDYAEQAMVWLAESLGQEPTLASQTASEALSGRFESGVTPSDEAISAVGNELGTEVATWLATK
ncbi:MAG: hypothetical protein HN348_18965 [Proteobacteria bacterium]|jgi:hypothetical protein|nr:hypothetical protein [Pseudomonadota bacterium]